MKTNYLDKHKNPICLRVNKAVYPFESPYATNKEKGKVHPMDLKNYQHLKKRLPSLDYYHEIEQKKNYDKTNDEEQNSENGFLRSMSATSTQLIIKVNTDEKILPSLNK